MSGPFELICHRRRHSTPTEHLSLFGKFQHCAQGSFSLIWRQREKGSRENATSPTNYGLAQAQVPMASCEDFIVRPTDLFAQQRRKCLVINEDGQESRDLYWFASSGSPKPVRAPSQSAPARRALRSLLAPPGTSNTASPRSTQPTTPPSSRPQRCRVCAGSAICPLSLTFTSPICAIEPHNALVSLALYRPLEPRRPPRQVQPAGNLIDGDGGCSEPAAFGVRVVVNPLWLIGAPPATPQHRKPAEERKWRGRSATL